MPTMTMNEDDALGVPPPPMSSASERRRRRSLQKATSSRTPRRGGLGSVRGRSTPVLTGVLQSPRAAAAAAAARSRAAARQRKRAAQQQQQQKKQYRGGIIGGGADGGGTYGALSGGSALPRGVVSCSNTTVSASAVSSFFPRNHSWMYNLLNPRSHQPHAVFFKRFIALVIVVDLIFFVCSTEPLWEGHPIFYYAEAFTSSIFLIEYLARFVTCTESTRFGPHGPIVGRIRFALSIPSVIDALATFPFFIELLTPLDLPTTTSLRIFRLLRLLKTEGFAKAFESVNRVIYYNAEILWVAAMLSAFLVLVTAVAMYYLRPSPQHGGGGEIEADFSSIPQTMYLTTLMLTGQGGPSGDLPWYTQAIVVLTGIFSVAMFAIPASMLTWGFEAEAARLAAKARRNKKRAMAASAAADDDKNTVAESAHFSDEHSYTSESSDAYESSSSVDTSDEEYQKIIGGEGEGESEDEKEDAERGRALREILTVFTAADDDGSGTLTKQEFVKMVEPLLEAATAAAAGGASSSGGGGGGAATSSAIAGNVRAGNAASTAGSASDVVVLSTRVARLEAKVDGLSNKLDRLIQLSERPGDKAYQDPFP